jgi:hypothetical protein
MADMTPLTDILNGDAADATDVQNNFQTIETYINSTNLIRADGTEVMAADLDMDGFTLANISGLDMNATQITDLAVPTTATGAARFGDAAVSDYQVTSGGTTITTSATTVVTFTVYAAAAGMAHITFIGNFTTSGVGSYDVGAGTGGVGVITTITGATLLTPTSTITAGQFISDTTQSLTNNGSPYLVSLASGTNTIALKFTRVNEGTTGTGGTLTADTGFRAMIVGA